MIILYCAVAYVLALALVVYGCYKYEQAKHKFKQERNENEYYKN